MSPAGTICPFCQRTVPTGKDVCPLCGKPVGNVGVAPVDSAISFASAPTLLRMPEDDPPTPGTLGAPGAGSPKSSPKSTPKAPPEPPETLLAAAQNAQRFHPGDLIADRYKIVSIIGKGGMGEVYRATDRTLSQDVALKFLPKRFINDPKAERHLLEEVRLARRVSHRNVCRVHDVEQSAEGLFITMELIEGEDLATIIRRVGRLSGTRAVAIAREICIGLAAAHDQGVIHRDLKPANVLIDRDGHVHLADFGLSALTTNAGKHKGGTPSYMPPEQVLGDPVGPAGDIYCLGLTLFEMFTGKPVFRPKDMVELLELHERGAPPPSSVEPAIDPLVENVILRCLERRPEERPASPLLVAAELPGGSLVAAALDAGLTLSPDMVASAGSCRIMPARTAVMLVVAIVLGLVLGVRLARSTFLPALVPLEKSADVLADTSRTMLKTFGYTAHPNHEAYTLDYYEELLSELAARDPSPNWWNQLRKPRPSPIDFWYRSHTRPLITQNSDRRVTWLDPAPEVPGMLSLRLDPGGRLRELFVVTAGIESMPQELTDPSLAALRRTGAEPDPALLFNAAGLDPAFFKPAESNWVHPVYCDQTFSFAGFYPDNAEQPITVAMGFFQGWPVSFRIIEKKLESASQFKDLTPPWQRGVGLSMQLIIIIATTLGAALLTHRHMKSKVGDLHGAFRLAWGGFILGTLSFLLRADHDADLMVEALILRDAAVEGVVLAAAAWVYYLAVEPYARREWPEALYAWSRLMKDRWTDPLVGRSVLLGVCAGVAALILSQVHSLSAAWIGVQPDAPIADPDHIAETLSGGREAFGVVLHLIVEAFRTSLLYFAGLILLVILVKRRTVAIAVGVAVHTIAWSLLWQTSWLSWVFGFGFAVLVNVLVLRAGLLALSVAGGTYLILMTFPITLDPATWYFGPSFVGVGLVALACGLGAASSLGWLGRGFAGDPIPKAA